MTSFPPTQSPLLFREVLCLSARLELSLGNLSAVRRWADTRLLFPEELPRLQEEREELLLARLLFAQGKAQAALGVLERWQADAQDGGRARSSLEIQLLVSLAHHLLKQKQLAREMLREVVSLAHAEGYLRLFLDEGEAMETFLCTLVSRVREKPLLTYLQSILRAFESQRATQSKLVPVAPAPLIEDISPQERQVLRLLVAGRSRQEIAEALVISINTVKTHLQRIYQKLQVASRFEACEVARHLDLQ